MIWHFFWGDWSQSEKIPEIKPPLVVHIAYSVRMTGMKIHFEIYEPLF